MVPGLQDITQLYEMHDHAYPIQQYILDTDAGKQLSCLCGPLKLDVYAYFCLPLQVCLNRTARIGHQCRKTTVLSCHRCLINTGFEKMNSI
jgi:hypothetical protein